MNSLIIITGCPGTGKSHWAKLVCCRFPRLNAFSFDEMKEVYWDRFGYDNNEEKTAINDRCLEDFYLRLEARLRAGEDILIEYPFSMRHAPVLDAIIQRTGCRAVTLYLHGDMPTIYARANARDEAGGRHPGHLLSCYHKGVTPPPLKADAQSRLTLEQFIQSCTRKNYDIRLGLNLPVDVTDFSRIDYENVYAQIAAHTGL